jgi:cystathionine beta-lyase/cystathionine gamma-synthase
VAFGPRRSGSSALPDAARLARPCILGARFHRGLRAVQLRPQGGTARARDALIDALSLFGIGYSFGGFESLATPVDPAAIRTASPWPRPREDGTREEADRFAVRLAIGLEDVADLMADLDNALAAWSAAR